MITATELLDQIDAFVARNGMSPTAFGRLAVGDPSLVGDLRSGRMPNLRTVGRLTEFMENYPAPAQAEAS